MFGCIALNEYLNGNIGGGGVLVVHQTTDTDSGETVLDKTYNEIAKAPFAILHIQNGGLTTITQLERFGYNAGVYAVKFGDTYTTDSEDGYPKVMVVN